MWTAVSIHAESTVTIGRMNRKPMKTPPISTTGITSNLIERESFEAIPEVKDHETYSRRVQSSIIEIELGALLKGPKLRTEFRAMLDEPVDHLVNPDQGKKSRDRVEILSSPSREIEFGPSHPAFPSLY
jgi:hypothetical protein